MHNDIFQAEDGIRDLVRSRGLGDVYKRQVWEEFREELQLTYDEMCEAIMFNEDRSLFNELMDRVNHCTWQEAQRLAWMQGEPPEYKRRVPEDCPF